MYKVDMEQKSLDWLKARHGNVTGTSLSSALGTPAVQKTLMYSLDCRPHDRGSNERSKHPCNRQR